MTDTITLLGSTGSIGTQTLEVAKPLGIRVQALAAGQNITLLEQQAREFHPRFVAVGEKRCYPALKAALADTPIRVEAGSEAVAALAASPDAGTVVNAVVGIAGLSATLAAVDAGNTLALANKESLVTGGDLVRAALARSGSAMLPVDSEHSAIFQCLNGEPRDRIKKILLTASGGPFFGKTRAQLADVTLADALHHPNWSMGKKITIDSATLMNKGLEVIEAMHLFDVPPDKIEVLVHRQSIVHSAVEFEDGAVIAQLGAPDMRLPIQYALTHPDRLPCPGRALSLFDVGALTFDRPDAETFSCFSAAMDAARRGGLAPCAVNGANEAAVALFLEGKIRFLDIGTLVQGALSAYHDRTAASISDVMEVDAEARAYVASHIA
jgi:1-deoxy-D-xylulose-5-phosphate reductoisomerase